MTYDFLTEDEQHDLLVQYAAAQERDHFLHTVNLQRAKTILADPALSQTFRIAIQKFHDDTRDRLHEVTHLLEKTRAQFPPADQLAAAKERHFAAKAAPPPRPVP